MSWSAFPFLPVISTAARSTASPYALPSLGNHVPVSGPSSRDGLVQQMLVSQVISPPTLSIQPNGQADQLSHSDDLPHRYSLGSASVGADCPWSWSQSTHSMAHPLPAGESKAANNQVLVESISRVPAGIRQRMAQFALASGRSESDLWAEAADIWLSSHTCDDEPLPPAPAAALAVPASIRSWDMIDDLLAALRTPVRLEVENESCKAA